MREIKFRAWDKERSKFIYSDWKYGTLSFWEAFLNDFTNEYEPLQQFTGLKDKNGKEIYEGDIVKVVHSFDDEWREDFETIGKVEFESGAFWINGGGYSILQHFHYNNADREVIGNIYYEHPTP